MKPSERRKQMKEEMAKRVEESYNSKESSGKFKSILNKEAMGSIKVWKCTEDEHFINIIPYVAGKRNPNVKEGKWAYNLDIYVHRKVGMNEDSYICLQRSYGKDCPICEEQARLRKTEDYDEAYAKSLNPTRRVLYNIECLDSEKETRVGIQLFEVSHWLFEKELAEISKKPKGGGFVLFSDPDEGKTLCFRKKGNGPTNTEYKGFQFTDRDEPISDDIIDAALCLDAIIHIPTYEEVKKAFFGGNIDDDEDTFDEPPKPEPKKPKKFVCPGTRPADYGELQECDDCPDNEACEKELQQEVQEEPKEEVPEKEEPKVENSEGRRVRRRPGA